MEYRIRKQVYIINDTWPEDELRPREIVNEVLTGRRKTHYGLKFEYDEAHRR